jgi:hypothetical protein
MNEKHDRGNIAVERIARHQKAMGLTDMALVSRYPGLGSAKTWRDRLCKGAWDEFGAKLDKWLRKLDAIVAEIDGTSPMCVFFEDLPFTKRLNEEFERLRGQNSDRRCLVVLATTGIGKSKAAYWLKNRYPREVVYVRVHECCRDSKKQIIKLIARALGLPPEHYSQPATVLEKIVESLKVNPQTIILDEAHEGGVLLLKIVKHLIDETKSRFVLLAFPTIWRQMLSASDDSRAEAVQLFGRTQKPVFQDYAQGVKREDVAFLLRQQAGLERDIDAVANRILPLVRSNGNLRLLADAIEGAQNQADVTDKPVDGELIVQHVQVSAPQQRSRWLSAGKGVRCETL